MLKFRDFEERDAETVTSWLDDERDFYYWSADRYGHYPITAQEIIDNYNRCKKNTFFKPMMLKKDGVSVAHLILRTPCADPKIIRLGFIISNNKLRGFGYGRAVTLAGIDYAKNRLGATEVNLGVFLNNTNAVSLYSSLGFVFEPEDGDEIHSFDFKGEKWEYGKMVYRG